VKKLTALARLSLLALLLGSSAHANTHTWNGGGGNNNWSTGTNWGTGGTAPASGDVLVFGGTTRLTPNNDLSISIAGITFNSGAGAFVIGGNSITLTGNVTDNETVNPQTINLNMTMSAPRTFTIASGGNLALGGVVGGAYALTQAGAGTLTLSGANSYSGGTVINGGTVSITGVAATGNQNLGTGNLTFYSGGTLLNTGTGAQTTDMAITLSTGGGVITMSGPNSITLTGAVSGGGGLTTGGGDLILTYAGNNAIGAITVSSGRLFAYTLSSINGSSIAVQSSAILDFNVTGGATPANIMKFASGAAVANRVGTLALSTTTATFPTTGTMIFNMDDQPTTAITVSGSYPALTGDLTMQVGGINATVGNVTLSGAISGSGGLIKTSTGTLILSSANSYNGGTTVSAGTLNVQHDGGLGSGNVTVANGATLTLNLGTAHNYINNSATVSVNGSGIINTVALADDDTVAALYINGVRQAAGTYGATGSGATYIDNTHFAGLGTLIVSAGAATKLIVTLPSQTFTSGSGNSGTVINQTAGTAFNITLTAVDSGNNIDTTFSGSQTVSYSGPGNAPGGATPTYTTTVTFTGGQATGVATTLTKAETTTITASISGLTGVASSSLQVNAGAANAAHSTVSPATASISANGASTQVITVQARDVNNNNLTSGGATVVISKSSGTGTVVSNATDNSDGTYTAMVQAPTAAGSGTFAATLGGVAVGTSVITYTTPTAVVLLQLQAVTLNGQVTVRWSTSSEAQTVGFDLYRLTDGQWTRLNTALIPAQGWPKGGIGASYSVADPGAQAGATYSYKLVERTTTGQSIAYGPFDRTVSAFVMTPLEVTAAGVKVHWLSRAGEQYRVLKCTDLAGGQYLPIAQNVAATPPENEYLDPLVSGAGFYRIELQP
jgi:autotransporter-associated beta strand protein